MLVFGFKELKVKLNTLEEGLHVVDSYLAALRRGGTKNLSMCVINTLMLIGDHKVEVYTLNCMPVHSEGYLMLAFSFYILVME
jgi:hypothetical protein